MTNLFPSTPIHIPDAAKRRRFAGIISEIITDLERENGPLFDAISVWWRNYEAIPRQQVKNHPFKNASNVVVPIAQMMVDALVARAWTALYAAGHRVWQARTENESNRHLALNMARYINWQADGNDFSFRVPSHDWILEMVAIGSSVLSGNWRTDERYAFTRQGRGKERRIKAQKVRFARGPILEHTPREQILWDTSYLIQEAPMVVRELALSWSKVAYAAKNDPLKGWDLDAVESIRQSGGAQGPSENVRAEKRQHDQKRRTLNRATSDHDIREVHLDWPLLAEAGVEPHDLATPTTRKLDTPEIPLVVTHHRKDRLNLRIGAEPYFVPYKPFFDIFYRKRSGRGHSVGLVKKLEGLQSGTTTIYNQGIDAQTRANSFFAQTTVRRLVDEPIDPAHPLFVPDMNSYAPLNIQGSDFGNIQLLQASQAIAERIAGQGDPQFGRETRMGGHPSPATSTIAMMQNADLLSGPMRDLVRAQLSRAGEFIASLDQQFEMNEDGKIPRVLGEIDAQHVSSFLFPTEPIPGNYQFNVRGLSQDLNPDAKMNRAVMVSQMNTNYWAGVLRATEALMRSLQVPNTPPEFQAIQLKSFTGFIRSQTQAHLDFLEAADVDDTERFVLALERNELNTGQALRAFAGQAGELAGPRALGPRPGVAGNGGLAGPRASEAFGVFGEPGVQ